MLSLPFRAVWIISIHALLAESDYLGAWKSCNICYFYPRSPCGERQPTAGRDNKNNVFLSTLSLRRATRGWTLELTTLVFLSTLSLRRATALSQSSAKSTPISIHALLAESDNCCPYLSSFTRNFYPRSPCGERPVLAVLLMFSLYFYPRSPCGERLIHPTLCNAKPNFYPRSPCGERLSSRISDMSAA